MDTAIGCQKCLGTWIVKQWGLCHLLNDKNYEIEVLQADNLNGRYIIAKNFNQEFVSHSIEKSLCNKTCITGPLKSGNHIAYYTLAQNIL